MSQCVPPTSVVLAMVVVLLRKPPPQFVSRWPVGLPTKSNIRPLGFTVNLPMGTPPDSPPYGCRALCVAGCRGCLPYCGRRRALPRGFSWWGPPGRKVSEKFFFGCESQSMLLVVFPDQMAR